MPRHAPQRQHDERRENGQHRDAANVLHPFAHVQAQHRRQRYARNRGRNDPSETMRFSGSHAADGPIRYAISVGMA